MLVPSRTVLLFKGDKIRRKRMLVSLSITYLIWNSWYELFKLLSRKSVDSFETEVYKTRSSAVLEFPLFTPIHLSIKDMLKQCKINDREE